MGSFRMEHHHMQTILRLPAVKTQTGLSRSTIYAEMAQNRFPQPITLGVRAVGWPESEIAAWLDSRKAARGAA